MKTQPTSLSTPRARTLALRPARRTALAGALVTALALALLAGGCDQRDAGAVAVEKASKILSAVTTDGARRSPNDAHLREQLKAALDSVRDIAKTDGPSSGAAGMIAGQTRAALADLDAAQAGEVAFENQLLIQRLRGALDQYTGSAGLAASLSGEDRAAEASETAQSLTQASAALAKTKASADAAEREAAKFQSVITASQAKAKSLRDRAAVLRLDASKTSATAAIALIEQAADAGRQADSLDASMVIVQAQATAKQTEAQAARAQADAQTIEVARLESEKAALADRESTTKTRLSETQAATTAAAADIARLATQVESNHTGKVRPAKEKALAGLREAMDLFRTATGKQTGPGAQSGKLGLAQISQSLADQLSGLARGEESLATAMNLLAAAQPPLDGAARYKATADEATAKFGTLIEEAREGYKKVREDLDAVSDPKLKARLSTALSKLELLSSKQGISTEQVTPEAFRDPAAVAAEKATAGLRKTVDAYFDAGRAGDSEAALALMKLDDESVKAAMLDSEQLGKTLQSLDEETKAKFGKGFLELMPGGQMLAPMVEAAKAMKERTSADFDYKISDDGKTATATAKKPIPGEPVTRLILDGETWKLTFDQQTAQMVKMGATMLTPMKTVFESILKDLRDGKIESEQQMVSIIKTKLATAMPGMPGGDK